MSYQAFLTFLISTCCAGILSLLLFRPLSRERVLSRLPLFLQTVSFVFLFGFSHLPEAFPAVFERALGHSIYQYDPVQNGTWIDESWWGRLSIAALAGVLLGLVWAIVNLTRRRAIYLNVVALVFAALWLVLAGVAYFVPRI